MKKTLDIDKVIVAILNGLELNDADVLFNNKKYDIKIIEKCIIKYFDLESFYDKFKSVDLNEELFEKLSKYLENYSSNKTINVKLSNELKDTLNNCDSKEIHNELRKYMQNRLTNIEVIKYIKKLIKDKDLYIYDRYINMKKNEVKKEIDRLTDIFKILDKLDYKINELGIEYKSITFDPTSPECMYISPSLNMDIYDITFYKRVLEKLKKMY